MSSLYGENLKLSCRLSYIGVYLVIIISYENKTWSLIFFSRKIAFGFRKHQLICGLRFFIFLCRIRSLVSYLFSEKISLNPLNNIKSMFASN